MSIAERGSVKHYVMRSIIPPDSILKEWEKDYQSMQNHFIYEEQSLSFNELIKRLEELTARIRNL